jgi:pyroglutamyl-peptidase
VVGALEEKITAMKRLLVTAFEPFDGETINPSQEVARRLAGSDFPETILHTSELPVDRFRAVDLAAEAIRGFQPDAIIMLGLAAGRYRVTPERVAINVDNFRIADNAGNQPSGEPIIEGGPAGYFSTLPIRAITDRLIAAHIPARISNTAGTYLCNRLFYSVMHQIAVEGLSPIAGFIHIPYLHEQTVNKDWDFPSLSRETLVEGIRLATEVTLTYLPEPK